MTKGNHERKSWNIGKKWKGAFRLWSLWWKNSLNKSTKSSLKGTSITSLPKIAFDRFYSHKFDRFIEYVISEDLCRFGTVLNCLIIESAHREVDEKELYFTTWSSISSPRIRWANFAR
jgi:hypothetical protein